MPRYLTERRTPHRCDARERRRRSMMWRYCRNISVLETGNPGRLHERR